MTNNMLIKPLLNLDKEASSRMLTIQNISEKIVSAIERDELDENIQRYIAQADTFLLNLGNEKPDFLDDVFDRTKSMLVSTVNSCIKSRNNNQKKDDLKKYKEGYFNEIIQNANDIAIYSNKDFPSVEIQCIKHEEDEYELICSYPDRGFSLTDIYGFCSRGNSNKNSKNGQEGMYGIGIKSLFCFADYFCIENNIKLELISTEKLLDTIHLTYCNTLPNRTTLTLKFRYEEKGTNQHAGFNVKKLIKFIDQLVAGEDCSEFFYSEDERKVLFDARSLIFTELKSNRSISNSIKEIQFYGNGNQLEIKATDKIYARNTNIKFSSVKDDMQYLIFNYPNMENEEESLSIAYAFNKDWAYLKDRIYATYFVSNYSGPLLERATGCLVNTKAINSSRSGLERESEDAPAILQTIKVQGQQSVRDLINLLMDDETEAKWKAIASDVLCHLLAVYEDCQQMIDEELLPSGIFKNELERLRKLGIENKIYLNEQHMYIFKEHEDDEIHYDKEIITKNQPANANADDGNMLYRTYKEVFVGKDLILKESKEYKALPFGIRQLAELMLNEVHYSWLTYINAPFIYGVKNLLLNRIGGTDFMRVMQFMTSYEQYRKHIKQLVSRFNVNNSFDYMGNYAKGSIVNWLFAIKQENDKEYEAACAEYEASYGQLKALITPFLRSTQYYHHQNANPDYWYKEINLYDFKKETVYLNQIRQFLNLLSKQVFCFGTNYYNQGVFVHSMQKNLTFRNRNRMTTGWTKGFSYFSLKFLNRVIGDLDNFQSFRQILDAHNKRVNPLFKLDYLNLCKLTEANFETLEKMFQWLAKYDYKESHIKLSIDSIVGISSDTTNLVKFTHSFLKDVTIRLMQIDAAKYGAKFIGYVTNYKSNDYIIKCRKTSDSPFDELSYDSYDNTSINEHEKKYLIVFYSQGDAQEALSNVLSDMGVGEEIPAYIKNFIDTNHIKQLSSGDYEKYLLKAETNYRYAFEYEDVWSLLNNNTNSLTMEDIFQILIGDMSYQHHCPICENIPTLNIKGSEKVSVNKNCLVVLIPALFEEQRIYVKIICCKSCFEEYKASLTDAKIITLDGRYCLQLRSTICDASRSYDFVKNVKLSPDNWRIIQDFNHDYI